MREPLIWCYMMSYIINNVLLPQVLQKKDYIYLTQLTSGFQYELRLNQTTTLVGIFLGSFTVSREFACDTAYPLRPSPPNTQANTVQWTDSHVVDIFWCLETVKTSATGCFKATELKLFFVARYILWASDTNGTILCDTVFDFGSAPHSLSTNSEKVHAIAQYCKSTFAFKD